jgi:collagenase-like PrtC family protease
MSSSNSRRWEKIDIREVYLSGPQEYSGSGRVTDKIDLDQFLAVVNRIHGEGLRVDLVMNSTCEGIDWYSPDVIKRKVEYIGEMHERYGIEAVTISNPIYIREVRNQLSDIEINASVLADIDCVHRASIFAKEGANTIIVDVNIQRDMRLLRQIKKVTGSELKLMVNEGCLYKCPYRKFHMNYISHRSQEIAFEGYEFSGSCGQVTINDSSQIFKSCWIRPEDVAKYRKVTHFFKIVGRDMLKSKVLRTTRAYLEQSFEGNLLDLLCSNIGYYNVRYSAYVDNKSLDREGFFEKVISCSRNCVECSYCKNLTDKLVRYGRVTVENLEDIGYTELAEQMKNKLEKKTIVSSRPSI